MAQLQATGVTGSLLVSDSITAPSFIGGVMPAYTATSGQYFPLPHGTYAGASVTTTGPVLTTPFLVTTSISVDRIAFRVVSVAVSGATARLAVYNSLNGLPNSLVFDAGTVSYATTGVYEITISQSLSPGLYFFALANNSSTQTVSVAGHQASVLYQLASNSSSPTATAASTNGFAGYSGGVVSGAFPASFGTATPVITTPDISLRVV